MPSRTIEHGGRSLRERISSFFIHKYRAYKRSENTVAKVMLRPVPPVAPSSSARPSPHSSRALFARAKLGDTSALGQLIARYLPRLHRWAHGRLHRAARSRVDTGDLVQDAALRALPRADHIDLSSERALVAYLRATVLNRIRDEHRRIARHETVTISESTADAARSPHDVAVRNEFEERYRKALTRLRPSDQVLIVAHVELDYTHEQLGQVVDRSPNAARMALQRALRQIANHMKE